jgi:hypothetical protein
MSVWSLRQPSVFGELFKAEQWEEKMMLGMGGETFLDFTA